MNVVVKDNVFDANAIEEALVGWPGPEAPWVRYDSPLERKQALNDWSVIPCACAELLRAMLLLDVASLLGIPHLVPDLSLFGAGLHEHLPGQHLDIHLDADRHRHTGLERKVNAILFLSAWEPDWGGPLELYSADLKNPVLIYPDPGRLVLFECNDQSYHGVPRPVRSPRRSLAAYWWAAPRGKGKRPRAQYIAMPHEAANPEKERLRQQRGI